MTFKHLRVALLAITVVTCLPKLSYSQAAASLRGRVTDPSGGAIPTVKVHLTRADTNTSRDTITNNEGLYEVDQLAPGTYTLTVAASGFAEAERRNLSLQVNLPVTADFQLQLASSTQKVEVTEAGAPMVNTTDATLGNVFDTKQVEQLPIEARNVVELLSLQPGVVYLGNRVDQNSDTRSGAVNGVRSDQSNITLDGVDVNDQNHGYAFNSVLRNTQDSVQEFRVTTSNSNADAGRSAGAQVALITKTGTNTFHGSLYEYNRNTDFAANEYFEKASELASGSPNQRSPLIRNVFGGSLAGPILKNRLFFFFNYEGRRDSEAASTIRTVPTASMRAGFLIYQNATGSTTTLTPVQIKQMDPLGIGEDAAVLSVLQGYPLPNDPTVGDSYNTSGFRFAANEKAKFDTYIGRLDYNLTADGRHTLFWRGNLQNDRQGGAPQFPGQAPATTTLDDSKGFATGYTAVLSPTQVNTFHWGFTRQGGASAGISQQPQVTFAGINSPVAFTRSNLYHIPVNNFLDDYSWTKGSHTMQFGANIRLIDGYHSNDIFSFPSANINLGWLLNSGIANRNVPFDPALAQFPPVSDGFGREYDNIVMTLVGMVTEGNAIYNYDKNGQPLAFGSPLLRDFRWNEYETYAQDSWKITRNLTLTYGVRWTLLQAPAETHGTQVGPCVLNANTCAPLNLTDWLNISAEQGKTGGAATNAPQISFAPNGRYNGKPDFWNPEYHDFAPRVAFAWAPDFGSSWLAKIFGPKDKSSIRAGYSLFYNHFGAATVNTYDEYGSFGLSSQVQNVPGSVTVSSAPRFTGITTIPPGLLPPAPAGGFPATPAGDLFAISWALDRGMKTPYSHAVDFSISREFQHDLVLDVAYVGNFARRLPEQEDVAMPLDLVDPKSHMDYFTAATMLAKQTRGGVPINNVQPIPYFEDLFAPLAGTNLGGGPLTATQAVYSQFLNNKGNESYALFLLDLPDSQTGANLNVPGHSYPSYRFYHNQYSSLYTWRTIGMSDYNALELTLHKRFSHGLQGDFNYTWSKSFDWTSQAERIPTSGGNNRAQIINTWKPDQLRGVSDFDATHQINANWIYDLPFGKGRQWAAHMNRWLDAVIGGWQLNGLFRWTSGFPFTIDQGATWPTNWNIQGWAMFQGPLTSADLKRGSGPNAFVNPQTVYNAFRIEYPGESGTRNPLRGDGYFGVDAGLSKVFNPTERVKLRLRWDVFNVTNSVRFDVNSIGNRLDQPSTFGLYQQTVTNPRVMQVALRIEF
ncbi:MAG: carboxypeptidase regulatory-like domain-containing protein [Bryobacteraceae bacterium]